jgi:hypothetical protein
MAAPTKPANVKKALANNVRYSVAVECKADIEQAASKMLDLCVHALVYSRRRGIESQIFCSAQAIILQTSTRRVLAGPMLTNVWVNHDELNYHRVGFSIWHLAAPSGSSMNVGPNPTSLRRRARGCHRGPRPLANRD